ncbi:glycosyltransferase family 4 protein [Kushneria indalinina]|uniref:Glycosyltransferase involved in cell wall biosynthesis n=1 Tax=Kushneria indalinina DSM 14324 TaxID=1122140 RepID=A0A3D9DYP8_9GAMM|nr:glycosyltransferase family 4 protein [Kushneria indalinina]REC95831.1 glycosyltransferase involved in cell wall biosynthesis [Kushneria indalinina DSM 14324]
MTSESSVRRLTLIVAGRPDQLTGGYIYDRRIVEALRETGIAVEVIGLDGRFPWPDDIARESLQRALGGCTDRSLVVVDGLAASAMPDVLEVHAHRLTLVALVHHPLGDETGLEKNQRETLLTLECQALQSVAGIIVTSAFTRRRLIELDIDASRISVIEPGITPVPIAPADNDTPRLLCIATLIPRKGQHLLIEALADLKAHDWHCALIGDDTRDERYTERLRDLIIEHQLEQRVTIHGAQPPEALEAHWQHSDLFVLPSFYEGYGMVIAEALAHGLPAVTTTGGALADTLPDSAGVHVPPDDAMALRDALRTLLFDDTETRSTQYQSLRQGALEARRTLNDWPGAAERFLACLNRLHANAVS